MGRELRGFRRSAICATLLSTLPLAGVAHATWPHDPSVNLPICTAANFQLAPALTTDGAGGAIVVWIDRRGNPENPPLYAQHVLASGAVDGVWPVNGQALSSVGADGTPAIVSDGAGGAIVTWGTFGDINAQHVLAAGVVDPAWPAAGRALCTAARSQNSPQIVSDGAGGAIVAWRDQRGGDTNPDIYAQHVLGSGVVDGAWPADGRALCTAANSQINPQIVSDGSGGAIVAWTDGRSGNLDVYAQHVLASGNVDGTWPADGRALCTATSAQTGFKFVKIVSDGAGGAIVTWDDLRSGHQVYAQHVLASGSVDGGWPLDGRAVCTNTDGQYAPTIVSDAAGGAIVAWQDLRSGTYDIYAQHVLASGALDGAWPADGRALCTAANSQAAPAIISDGGAGAIVCWTDSRGTDSDIYAQRVLSGGGVDGGWPVNGRALSSAAGNQTGAVIVSDGANGTIAAWQDARAGLDIYAQRVAPSGFLGNPEPRISSVSDVPKDNGGVVQLSWTASYMDTEAPYVVDHYSIFRAVAPAIAAQAPGSGAQAARAGDFEPSSGARAHRGTPPGATGYTWEYLGSQPATHAPTYDCLAATAGDSVAAGPMTVFLVVATNADSSVAVASDPDSGYSVDNLPPGTPAPFVAGYTTTATYLHWGANPEPDIGSYHLHRGDAAVFVPGPANLLATLPDTGFVDTTSTWSYYKLSAVDTHGHESGFALLVPGSQASGGTPADTNVHVTVGPSVGLTFKNVTSGGQTDVTIQTGGTAPPSGFKLSPTSPTKYYVITTTATFTGIVTVCINYADGDVGGNESHLKLMVYDSVTSKWVNITTTRDPVANTICGTTTHFSEFALMEPISSLAVDDAPPAGVWLYPATPNPTPAGSTIRFVLPRDGPVTLGIYDAGGRLIRELTRGVWPAGEHATRWDGRDASGRRVANGLYLARLEAGGRTLVQKVVAMR